MPNLSPWIASTVFYFLQSELWISLWMQLLQHQHQALCWKDSARVFPFWSYEGFAFFLRFSTFNTGKQASLHAVSTPDQLTYTASKVWEMLLLFVSMQMVCNGLFGSWRSVQGREDLSSYLLIDKEIRFVWDSPPLRTCQLLGKTKTWNPSGCLMIEKCFFSLQLLFATNGRQGT